MDTAEGYYKTLYLCGYVFNPVLLDPLVIFQKPQPAKKEKKKKEEKKKVEEEDDGSRDIGMPAEEKKAPHPLAVMDKEAKSPFAGDTWKKVNETPRITEQEEATGGGR